ncbi:hypothetical protein [Stenotrophomonas sp. 57]|uniref:hypothetical protein n=1 Tax=Stenotrophomonas sp. 57 TaxID=3051119 RepID=UPI00256EB1A9|nr:hypothetical protein [Stenotrophomonas sp. 57]
MRTMLFVGTLSSVTCLFAHSALAGDAPESTNDCAGIAQLMANDDFSALDAMASRLRTGELDAAGESRLGRFYICMSRAIGTARQEIQAWNDWSAWAARWVQHAPASPTAHLMTARIPLNLAWSYRGDGYSNAVKAEDWARFHEYNAVSQAYLQSHEGVAGGDPFWHEMSVLIALRENAEDDELLALVDRAAKAFPDYEPLHLIAMQHFTPAWGGSAQKMEAFARHSMASAPKKKRAMRYARLYWSSTAYSAHDFRNAKPDWPLMRQGLDDIAQRYPTVDNLETITRFACWARDGDALVRWNRLWLSRSGFGEAVIADSTEQSKAACLASDEGQEASL